MQEITRRKTVLGAVGISTAALAGCVSEDAGDDDNGDDEGEPAGTGSGDGSEISIEESEISHVGSDCADSDAGEIHVSTDDGTYWVEGTAPSPNPCYKPELLDTDFEDGTLSVTVDVVEDIDEDEVCPECVGKVLYEATVELSEETDVDRVSVTHESGETHTVDADDIAEGRPEIESASIDTIRADSREHDDDQTEVDRGEETATIDGIILTNTPHYEAVLEDTAIQHGQLQVEIDVESTLDDDMAGTTEVGEVEYEATIEISNADALESIQIDHPESSHSYGWATATDSGSEADDHSSESGGETDDHGPESVSEADDYGPESER